MPRGECPVVKSLGYSAQPPARSFPAVIAGFGSAMPPILHQQNLWDEFFAEHYAGSSHAGSVWQRCGVSTRHGVVDPRVEDLSGWSTAARMRRFLEEALPLGKEALAACLLDAGLSPGDVDALTVVSCTGYATPGLDILLARDLGMDRATQRLHVGHMGCYAALPALGVVSDAAVARGKTAVMLCIELTSLHIQPASADVDQMVAHALFSDAAAAVALRPTHGPTRRGLEVVDLVARTDVARAELMTWDVTDQGFRMSLSPRVPRVLSEHVVDAVGELVGGAGIAVADVAAWAVHPGGPRILDVVEDRLGLAADGLAVSREVLREDGNCSSATVLLILDRLVSNGHLHDGDHVVCMAFGPGLTLYAALLRYRH
jgi:predicted naringenin-chalcone synthase